jgi:branched-chain amino acid transport system ATP-binding protein
MGLVKARSGIIRIEKSAITGLPPHEICRRGIGWVPQGRRLFSHLTVEENIRLATFKRARTMRRNGFDEIYALFPILRERRAVFAVLCALFAP